MADSHGGFKGQLFAVEKFGVEDDVLELYRQGVPATKISKSLLDKGVNIAPLAINRWLAKFRAQDLPISKQLSDDKFELMVMDYRNEITMILNEVKEMKAIAREEKKLDQYVKLVGKLYDGIELLAKLMGDIKPQGSVDVNVIINEINLKTLKERSALRSALHGGTIIDVEADILEEDKKAGVPSEVKE